MNSLSDIVGRKQTQQADADSSPFVLRRLESSRAMAERLARQASGPEPADDNQDPLIRGLVGRLPKPSSTWCLEDRVRWLRTADRIFDLIYSADDKTQKEIKISVVDL